MKPISVGVEILPLQALYNRGLPGVPGKGFQHSITGPNLCLRTPKGILFVGKFEPAADIRHAPHHKLYTYLSLYTSYHLNTSETDAPY